LRIVCQIAFSWFVHLEKRLLEEGPGEHNVLVMARQEPDMTQPSIFCGNDGLD